MYLNHFGLREAPFGITPDTAFTYCTRSHQAALNTLLVALEGGEGFIKITGEVGTGKTLLCRRLLASLDPARYLSAYLPNPLLDPQALLSAVAEELGVEATPQMSGHALLKALNSHLMQVAAEGRSVVLCLDEAQALPRESLEALRLLSNLESEKRKLLHLVLFGQPELDARLARPELRQLRQRIAFSHTLKGLEQDELAQYIVHRLRVAGYAGDSLFSPCALGRLHRASGGVPRRVNMLAHKAMLLAYGQGGNEVLVRHVRAAANDDGDARPLFAASRWWLGLGLASMAGVAGAVSLWAALP